MASRPSGAVRCTAIAVFWLLLNINVTAHTQTLSQLPPAEPQGPLLPIVNPAQQNSHLTLIEELRKGGFVLYMRHATTGRITEQCGVSNLTTAGEEQAKLIGAAIRALTIPIGEIWSSPACRALDTARLVDLRDVSVTDDLAQVATAPGQNLEAARQRRLNMPPVNRSNTVLVSHMHSGTNRSDWIHLAIGEVIVFRHVPSANAVPVARILARDWGSLKAAYRLSTPTQGAH
jgi:hypothetical protein